MKEETNKIMRLNSVKSKNYIRYAQVCMGSHRFLQDFIS